MTNDHVVIIVGAGQSGLATAAYLNSLSIPSLILERDNCVASLWRNRSYDRVSLHLAKQACTLPFTPHSPQTPMFMHKNHFIRYLDNYAAVHKLRIELNRCVESAEFDESVKRWRILAAHSKTGVVEEYTARYLVVATGENDEKFVPDIPGLDSFNGTVVHSSEFRCGSAYRGKDVLVVGCGNSGMEIAYDLADNGARASIVVRDKLHIVSKEIFHYSILPLRFLPAKLVNFVDSLIVFLCNLKFGDLAKYGLRRPDKGPLHLKRHNQRPIFPVMDVGTVNKIKSGEIKVMPAIENIKGNFVASSDGIIHYFDAIVLATGYRSAVKKWLKGDDDLFGDDGMAKKQRPDLYWKGKNGLYAAGFARTGIFGSGIDAESIAKDIASDYKHV